MDAVTTASNSLLSAVTQFDAASARLTKAVDTGAAADPTTPTIQQVAAAEQFHGAERALSAADANYKASLDITV